MTNGEKLLNLTVEYQRALDGVAQDDRTPQVIAAEYEQTIKDVIRATDFDGGTP